MKARRSRWTRHWFLPRDITGFYRANDSGLGALTRGSTALACLALSHCRVSNLKLELTSGWPQLTASSARHGSAHNPRKHTSRSRQEHGPQDGAPFLLSSFAGECRAPCVAPRRTFAQDDYLTNYKGQELTVAQRCAVDCCTPYLNDWPRERAPAPFHPNSCALTYTPSRHARAPPHLPWHV